jgi:aspartyl-tRNA(Asn)/glutamyl-tRNA(Gln) amidotransferase subunit A
MTMSSSSDPTHLSASELVAHYHAKTLSPVEVVEATLARIERLNPIVNAYCHLDAAGATAAARAAEARWLAGTPMGLADGVPVGIKDNIAVAGMPSRFGSRLTSEAPLGFDAPVVARLKEHGAILLGKTAMPEFGWKATSDSPLTGITRNPWDTRLTTGGSSAGAAAAAVLGMGSCQLGTDGGGSIRIPAAFTGCYGLKPSRGRVAVFPASALGTLAHHGPLTRTVADAALMLTIIAAPDQRDPAAWIDRPPDYRAGLEDGVAGVRMAYAPRLGLAAKVDPEVAELVARAVQVFEHLGARVELADPDIGEDAIDAWNALWWPGMAYQLAPFQERPAAESDPLLVAGADAGLKITAVELIRAALKRAQLNETMHRFHQRYQLLLTPALPLPAFEAGHLLPPAGGWGTAWTDWAPFSFPFNLTQQPAAALPCGQTKDGLPVALQVIGAIGADPLVLRASRAFEAAHPLAMLETPRRR